MRFRRKSTQILEGDLTPMIDMTFQLIAFFMLIINFSEVEKSEEINLPLRVDLDDRPRQLVCEQYGKPAKTFWEWINSNGDEHRVYFYPHTGRTHQLRVHASHPLGLNLPIKGDDLYGTRMERLYLHSDLLEFVHPISKSLLSIQANPDF